MSEHDSDKRRLATRFRDKYEAFQFGLSDSDVLSAVFPKPIEGAVMDELVKVWTDKGCVTVVVDENRVEDYSTRGFRLIEIVHTDMVEEIEEKTKDDENGYGNSYGTKVHTVTKGVVLRKPRFVMVMDGSEALAEKQGEVHFLEKAAHDLRSERDDFEKKVTDLDGEVKGLEADKRRLATTIADKLKEITAERTSKRKLEEDIGKLRTALGDLRMKEIIGG